MDRNEAAAALADVGRTEGRLADRARWPFHRHVMYGLGTGLIVASAAQPVALAVPLLGVAAALFAVCILDDRRRHGMFVSGWQPGATRPLTILLVIFCGAMVLAAAAVRDGGSAEPLGYLFGAITAAVAPVASLRWERVYRAELAGRAGR